MLRLEARIFNIRAENTPWNIPRHYSTSCHGAHIWSKCGKATRIACILIGKCECTARFHSSVILRTLTDVNLLAVYGRNSSILPLQKKNEPDLTFTAEPRRPYIFLNFINARKANNIHPR